SVVAPGSLAGKTSTTISVERSGTRVSSLSVSADVTAPALFTANQSGTGPVAALNEDGSVNSASRPAPQGSVVVLYGTGAGLMTRQVADGQVMDANLTSPQAPVFVRVGKFPAEILYAGSAPGLVAGALQINVRIPRDLPQGGDVPVQLIVGTYA